MVRSACPVAAEEDLVIRPDRHALRGLAAGERDDKRCLNSHRFWVDHRDPTSTAGTIYLRQSDIEFPGPVTPLALLGAVYSLRRAAHTVEDDLLHDAIGLGRYQAGEGERRLGVVRRQHQVVTGIVAHFVEAIDPAGTDRVGDLLREEIDDLEGAVAIAGPYLAVS